MKTTLITTAIAALLLGSAASAQPAPRAGATMTRADFAARLDRRFAQLDVNRDGVATAAELGARKQARGKPARSQADRIARRFARMDLNRNGTVTLAEMQAAGERRGDRTANRGNRRGGMNRGMARGVGRMDANGDGAVSRAEFQVRGMTRFARLDLDRNGVVTPAERQQAKAQRQDSRAR